MELDVEGAVKVATAYLSDLLVQAHDIRLEEVELLDATSDVYEQWEITQAHGRIELAWDCPTETQRLRPSLFRRPGRNYPAEEGLRSLAIAASMNPFARPRHTANACPSRFEPATFGL